MANPCVFQCVRESSLIILLWYYTVHVLNDTAAFNLFSSSLRQPLQPHVVLQGSQMGAARNQAMPATLLQGAVGVTRAAITTATAARTSIQLVALDGVSPKV